MKLKEEKFLFITFLVALMPFRQFEMLASTVCAQFRRLPEFVLVMKQGFVCQEIKQAICEDLRIRTPFCDCGAFLIVQKWTCNVASCATNDWSIFSLSRFKTITVTFDTTSEWLNQLSFFSKMVGTPSHLDLLVQNFQSPLFSFMIIYFRCLFKELSSVRSKTLTWASVDYRTKESAWDLDQWIWHFTNLPLYERSYFENSTASKSDIYFPLNL